MNKQQTDLFMKIVIVLLIIWLIKDSFTSHPNPSCSVVKSNFFIPQAERDLMRKNTVYVYMRNPFLDESYKPLDIETLRNTDDLTDRSKFSYIMETYYKVQNQHFHIVDDIANVVKQLRNLYNINDIQLHSSATEVVDFSDAIAYQQILNELSSTTVANTKSTFTSTYDANIITTVTKDGLGQSILPNGRGMIDFNFDSNVKKDMVIVSKSSMLTSALNDKNFLRIMSVTKKSNNVMTLEIVNSTDQLVSFDALSQYNILQRKGEPIITLTKFLYDQTIRDDEIVVVFNNKMVSFNTDSFDPNIFLIRYSKNKRLDFEIPPYQNFRRQQLMQLLYKNHF